ncbi:40S ribosomal protein S5-1 [Hordeum vulgare]|nr:40S ribosomal protein S5-1 [Hordeum vulgare]
MDKFFEKVINPYLEGVLQHPQSIKMHEGVLHIRDVEGPKKTGSVEARLEAMEQQVFKCQGMVERGLNANHMMISEFTNKQKIDANAIGKHLSRLYDRIDHLQAQIYDLQNQNYNEILKDKIVASVASSAGVEITYDAVDEPEMDERAMDEPTSGVPSKDELLGTSHNVVVLVKKFISEAEAEIGRIRQELTTKKSKREEAEKKIQLANVEAKKALERA